MLCDSKIISYDNYPVFLAKVLKNVLKISNKILLSSSSHFLNEHLLIGFTANYSVYCLINGIYALSFANCSALSNTSSIPPTMKNAASGI